MERILTNLQIQWLSSLKLLNEYEDGFYSQEDFAEKLNNYIENNYPAYEEQIIEELEVLNKKGFITLETEELIIKKVTMNKLGLDYLVMLEEDFLEKTIINEDFEKIFKLLKDINSSIDDAGRETSLDKIVQYTSICSNITSIGNNLSFLGNVSQGLISLTHKAMKNWLFTKR